MTDLPTKFTASLDTDRKLNTFYSSSTYLPPNRGAVLKPVKQAAPVLLIVPELIGATPSPCSYIRTLEPLLGRVFQEQFQVRISSVEFATAIHADVVIVSRLPCDTLAGLEPLLAHIRRINAKLIYEIDDNLLNLDAKHPEKSLYKDKEAVVSKLLSEADLVWTSTEDLADCFRPLSKRICVFENYLEPNLLDTETKPPPLSDKFRILYMGTKTHSSDLDLVLGPLRRLHSDGRRVQLNIIGISPNIPDEAWINVIDPPASPYPLFMQWLRSLPRFDLGIAPLESTYFNQCKSPIKYWDYTSLGIATLASNFGAYKKLIMDGETGFLATDSEDWYSKLRQAIDEPGRLPIMVSRAKGALKKLYIEANGVERRKEAILELLDRSGK